MSSATTCALRTRGMRVSTAERMPECGTQGSACEKRHTHFSPGRRHLSCRLLASPVMQNRAHSMFGRLVVEERRDDCD